MALGAQGEHEIDARETGPEEEDGAARGDDVERPLSPRIADVAVGGEVRRGDRVVGRGVPERQHDAVGRDPLARPRHDDRTRA